MQLRGWDMGCSSPPRSNPKPFCTCPVLDLNANPRHEEGEGKSMLSAGRAEHRTTYQLKELCDKRALLVIDTRYYSFKMYTY